MNRSRFGFVIAAAIMLAALAMPVAAGSAPKLHPSGFGEHSYASWKAGEGLPDSAGNKDQALYLQKMTATTTNAAGVAVFKGFEGTDTAELGDMEFWVGEDGWCGAGAPRFNVRIQPSLGPSYTFFIGCQMMTPGATAVAPNGRVYHQRTYSGPLPSGTVTGLAIVFDEGSDVGPGFVYLDNIRVGGFLWTSASDNGGGNTTVDAVTLEAMWGAPLATLLR
jgi:hypothetical protein